MKRGSKRPAGTLAPPGFANPAMNCRVTFHQMSLRDILAAK